MRRGGGDAGDNPRGRINLQYNMPAPKFLQQLKEQSQTSEQRKTKELEERLNRDEDFDIHNAIVYREQEEKQKEIEKVDMDSFKPKYVSKNDRNGLNALKDEIDNKKKEELKKKQLILKKLEDEQQKQEDGKSGDKKDSKKNNSSSQSQSSSSQPNLLNQKRKSIEEAVKQLEKQTTIKKQVKKTLLTFDADDDE